MFVSYILLCADGTLYSGSTNDIEKRLHAHNHLKNGAHYTKIRRPVSLVHKECFETFREARRRESVFKKMTKKEKESLIGDAADSILRRG